MSKEKMTVQEFVKKYNELSSEATREALIDRIITRKYAPIVEKRAALDLILEKCIQEKDGVEYIDSFLMQVGFMSVVVSLYTSLDFSGNIFDNYDLLMKDSIYPIIMYKVGKQDIKELMKVRASVEETFANKHTWESYLASQVTRFGELIGTVGGQGLEALAKTLENEETMSMVSDKY